MSIAEIETKLLGLELGWENGMENGKQLTKGRNWFVKQNHNYVAAGNNSRA